MYIPPTFARDMLFSFCLYITKVCMCNFSYILNRLAYYHICRCMYFYNNFKCIGSVMVSILTSSAVDRGFKPQSGYRDYKICIFCFSAKQAALRSKDWLARNQDNVYEWRD